MQCGLLQRGRANLHRSTPIYRFIALFLKEVEWFHNQEGFEMKSVALGEDIRQS